MLGQEGGAHLKIAPLSGHCRCQGRHSSQRQHSSTRPAVDTAVSALRCCWTVCLDRAWQSFFIGSSAFPCRHSLLERRRLGDTFGRGKKGRKAGYPAAGSVSSPCVKKVLFTLMFSGF